jgi:hypothetical protein
MEMMLTTAMNVMIDKSHEMEANFERDVNIIADTRSSPVVSM